ncbi:MAG: YfiR family protein [Gammaproteobacteria bacterium]
MLPTLIAITLTPIVDAADNPLEARVKAAYLFNLSLLVEWPDLPADAFTLCISGDSGIGAALQELETRSVRERPLRVAVDPADVTACQVLFIGSGAPQWWELLDKPLPGLLTVSDSSEFASRGGVVGFYTDEGKIRLEVSRSAAELAGLSISSRVLEIARVLP